MGIVLTAEGNTNFGRPLPVLIRATSRAGFRGDSYAAIERLAVLPDQTVLRVLTLFPGTGVKRKLKVPVPPEPFIAVYALYTNPAGAWKVLFEPKLPLRATVPLGRQSINIAAIRECRLPFSGIDPEPPPSKPDSGGGRDLPSASSLKDGAKSQASGQLQKAQQLGVEQVQQVAPVPEVLRK